MAIHLICALLFCTVYIIWQASKQLQSFLLQRARKELQAILSLSKMNIELTYASVSGSHIARKEKKRMKQGEKQM